MMSQGTLKTTISKLALALPHVEEKSHLGKTDYRVKNRIFLSCPNADSIVVKLLPDQQELFANTQGGVVAAVPGGWGAQGWTSIDIANADIDLLKQLLELSWLNVAQKRMIQAFQKDQSQ